MVTKVKIQANANIEEVTPCSNAIPTVTAVTVAVWLDGIPPVPTRALRIKSLVLNFVLLESSTIIFINCAMNQLNAAATKH
jgi:hypothetical protein